MESLSIISSWTLLPHHPAFRRIDLAPAVRRLHFPRPSAPRHHTVRCSHRPPPKEREVKKKGRWKAATAVTVAVACTLGAVYLSRAAPASLPNVPGIVTRGDKNKGVSGQNDESSEKENPVLDRTRDEVRKIMFEKETCCSAPHLIDSWMNEPTGFDAALMVVQWNIAKKRYHAAKEICKQIKERGSSADARPLLLMAVIEMMMAVEAMLKPETGEKDLKVFVDRATEWWKNSRESIGGKTPNVTAN